MPEARVRDAAVLRASRSSLDRRYMEEGVRELGVVADLVARALVEAERE